MTHWSCLYFLLGIKDANEDSSVLILNCKKIEKSNCLCNIVVHALQEGMFNLFTVQVFYWNFQNYSV